MQRPDQRGFAALAESKISRETRGGLRSKGALALLGEGTWKQGE